MKIGQLAKLTGVSARAVRHYDKKGLLPATRSDNNYREFDESVVETIHTIQLYLQLGLTTDQIKDLLYCPYIKQQESLRTEEYCEELYELYKARKQEISRQRHVLEEAWVRLGKQIQTMEENRDKWV
ncbi:MerR family transcriptional regulator [Paenibacillus sp. GCM10027627]|uniref:MerR family transcriptional regulator n=1 Tax=unclassified Paenibacillus TaxID=185978 RepID=UPI0036451B5D